MKKKTINIIYYSTKTIVILLMIFITFLGVRTNFAPGAPYMLISMIAFFFAFILHGIVFLIKNHMDIQEEKNKKNAQYNNPSFFYIRQEKD